MVNTKVIFEKIENNQWEELSLNECVLLMIAYPMKAAILIQSLLPHFYCEDCGVTDENLIEHFDIGCDEPSRICQDCYTHWFYALWN